VKDSNDADLKDETDLAALKITEVGDYRITVSVVDSTNSQEGTKSLEFTVTKGTIDLSSFASTCSAALPTSSPSTNYVGAYTGSEQTFSIDLSKVAAPTAEEYQYLTMSYSGNKATDAGKYTATVTFGVTSAQSNNWTVTGGTSADKNVLKMEWNIGKAASYNTADKALTAVDSDTITIYSKVNNTKDYSIMSTDLSKSLIDAGLKGAYLDSIVTYGTAVGSYATLFSNSTVSGAPSDSVPESTRMIKLTAKADVETGSDYYVTFKFVSDNYEAIYKTVKVVAKEYTDVSGQIVVPNATVSYTYTGAGQELLAVDKAYMKGTGVSNANLTFSYTTNADSATASLDANGLPKSIGTYDVTVKYLDDANQKYGETTMTLKITAAKLTITGYTLSGRPYVKNDTSVNKDSQKLTDITVTGLLGTDEATVDDFVADLTKGVFASDAFGAQTVTKVYFTLASGSKLNGNYVLEMNQADLVGTSTITGAVVSNFSVTAEDADFTGSAVYPKLTFKGGSPAAEIAMVEGTDYTVVCTAVNVGLA
jgi:hypothetical protein